MKGTAMNARMTIALGALVAVLTLASFAVPAAEDVVARGSFYDSPYHSAAGEAALVAKGDGSFEVRLSAFRSDPGPDVYVIFSTADKPTKDADITGSRYVTLGPIKATTGDQAYAVPAGVDTRDFRSIGLWCAQYSVLFGAAALAAE